MAAHHQYIHSIRAALMGRVSHLLDVPIIDPDWARRRRLLNTILVGIFVLTVLTLLTTLAGASRPEDLTDTDAVFLLASSLILIAVEVIVFLLNRRRNVSAWLPATLLVAILYMALSVSDSPKELTDGRSLILWFIPIVFAPVLLPPVTAFVAAGASSVALVIFGFVEGSQFYQLNFFAMFTLFAFALLAWLSAHALEQAIFVARREAAQNQAILDSISDGVVVVDHAKKVIQVNPAMRAMLSADDLAHLSLEGRTTLPDARVIEARASPVPALGMVAVARDVTRQAEIDRMKDAMLGTVSHELRTPLSALIGFSEIIRMTNTAPTSEYATRISSGAKRLLNLVNNLLDRAQIEAGVIRINVKPFELRKLANDIAFMFQARAKEYGLNFSLTVEENTPMLIIGDADRLMQVAVNLLDNAVKFSDQGGSVALRFFGDDNDKQWGFDVQDTGIGIRPERLPDIFEPIRRASDYDTRTRQGAGLGLSIAKSLIDRMSGEITVQSKIGEGSTFTVTFTIGAT